MSAWLAGATAIRWVWVLWVLGLWAMHLVALSRLIRKLIDRPARDAVVVRLIRWSLRGLTCRNICVRDVATGHFRLCSVLNISLLRHWHGRQSNNLAPTMLQLGGMKTTSVY